MTTSSMHVGGVCSLAFNCVFSVLRDFGFSYGFNGRPESGEETEKTHCVAITT